MNDRVRDRLCDQVRAYGADLCRQPKRVRALLGDLCPHDQREINVLMLALQAGVVESLQGESAGTPWLLVQARLVQALVQQLAMDQEAATWAVASWGQALGKCGAGSKATAPAAPTLTPATAAPPRPRIVKSKPYLSDPSSVPPPLPAPLPGKPDRPQHSVPPKKMMHATGGSARGQSPGNPPPQPPRKPSSGGKPAPSRQSPPRNNDPPPLVTSPTPTTTSSVLNNITPIDGAHSLPSVGQLIDKLYREVPWYRRSGTMTVFVLSGFFCFTPLLIAACIICLTGNVYYNRTNEDGALAVWPRGNKTAAVIFLVLHGLIIWHWANRLFSSPDPEQVAAEVKQLILREWRQDPALQNSLKAIRHISLVHQGGGQYAGFLEATIDGNTVRMSLEVAYVRGYIRWQLKPLASVSPTTTERPTEGIGTTFTNSIGMTFTYIPAGEFLMGSRPGETDRAEDEHQHRVRITKPYYLGIHEVTQEQYEKVMGSNPSHFKGATLPVEMISWDDVQEFLSKLNDREKGTGREYRLPTEAEWEYACRAGTSSPFHYGSSLDTTQANFDGRFQHDRVANGDYRKQSTPVGTFKPNALGLFDMHGNVKEWCQDYYGVDYYNESHHHDPINEQKAIERVVRSGSWSCSSRYCRSAYRHNYRPDTRFDHLGFRVAVTVTHTKAP